MLTITNTEVNEVADHYVFALVSQDKTACYGTHVVYSTVDDGMEYDGGTALDVATGQVQARGFEVTGSAFADSSTPVNDVWELTYFTYDDDDEQERFLVLPVDADGVIFVTLGERVVV